MNMRSQELILLCPGPGLCFSCTQFSFGPITLHPASLSSSAMGLALLMERVDGAGAGNAFQLLFSSISSLPWSFADLWPRRQRLPQAWQMLKQVTQATVTKRSHTRCPKGCREVRELQTSASRVVYPCLYICIPSILCRQPITQL